MKILSNQRTSQHRCKVALLALFAIMNLASLSTLLAEQPLFKALVVRGKSEVQQAGKSASWEKISVGTVFDANDKLRVGKDSYLFPFG